VLVVHHNVLRASSRGAWARPLAPGAATHPGVGRRSVLCGHDHQEGAEQLGAGWWSRRGDPVHPHAGRRPSSFNFVTIEPTAVHITYFRWDAESRRFRASDTYAFARAGKGAAPAPSPSQPVPADTTSHS